jgi:hypothetical protein
MAHWGAGQVWVFNPFATQTIDGYSKVTVGMAENVYEDPRTNWHGRAAYSEPPCGVGEWRCKDRESVIKMSEMCETLLVYCIKLSFTISHHSSKIDELLAELNSREVPDATITKD